MSDDFFAGRAYSVVVLVPVKFECVRRPVDARKAAGAFVWARSHVVDTPDAGVL